MLLYFFSRKKRELQRQSLFRNFIFGVEDSLVSTVGLLSGVAVADTPRLTIITTGVILIFVEAFSMGIGSFLSEETSSEMSRKKFSRSSIMKSSMVMFISYFLAGLIPLSPYVFSVPYPETTSIIMTLISLGILGAVSAKIFKGSVVWKAIEMFLLGGVATLIGIAVGSLVS